MARIESLPDPNLIGISRPLGFSFQSYGNTALTGSLALAEDAKRSIVLGKLRPEALLSAWQVNLESAGFSLPDLSVGQLPEFSRSAHTYIHGYFNGVYTLAQSNGLKEPAAVPYTFMDNRLTSFYDEHLSSIGAVDKVKVARLGKIREQYTGVALKYQALFPEITAAKSFADTLIASRNKVAANGMYNLLTVYGMTVEEIIRILKQREVKQKVSDRDILRRPFK